MWGTGQKFSIDCLHRLLDLVRSRLAELVEQGEQGVGGGGEPDRLAIHSSRRIVRDEWLISIDSREAKMAESKPSNGSIANSPDYDAVVVGASLAGCATAILLGRAGLSVALVEKRPDPERLQAHVLALHPGLGGAGARTPRPARADHRGGRAALEDAGLDALGLDRSPAGQGGAGGQPAARAARPDAARGAPRRRRGSS